MHGNRLMLIIALAAGVMATVLAFTYISSATSALDEQTPEETVEVLFVKNDLPPNHELDPDADLRLEQIGVVTYRDLARTAVKANERESLHGKIIQSALPAGVPLLYSHLTPIQDVDLAPGARALTINVDRANLMGGILVPGDHVDILVSFRKSGNGEAMPPIDMSSPEAAMGAVMGQMMNMGQSTAPSEWETIDVLSNVRVIAVGERLSVSRQAHLYGMSGLGGASTVTLEVTPDQAKSLINSTAGGTNPLTLLLRPPVVTDDGGDWAAEG